MNFDELINRLTSKPTGAMPDGLSLQSGDKPTFSASVDGHTEMDEEVAPCYASFFLRLTHGDQKIMQSALLKASANNIEEMQHAVIFMSALNDSPIDPEWYRLPDDYMPGVSIWRTTGSYPCECPLPWEYEAVLTIVGE